MRCLQICQTVFTYICLIPYRIMPFGYVSVLLEPHHAPISVLKPMNLHTTLWLSSNHQNPSHNVDFNRKFGRFFSEQTQSDSSTWHSCIIWSSCSRIRKEIYCTINHHSYSSVAAQPLCGWSQTSLLGQGYYSWYFWEPFLWTVAATRISIAPT